MVTKSKIIEVTVLGLWLLIAIVLFLRSKTDQTFVPPYQNNNLVEAEKKYYIKKITVVDSNSFDISLKDSVVSRIYGCLPVKGTSDAKKKLIEVFNHAQNPKVYLKEKDKEGKWIVDIVMDYNEKEINLVDWMKSNNLVYQ